MKVLGIDPGMAILGWSVIEPQPSGQHEVRFGTIQTPAGEPLTQRLKTIYDELHILCDLHKPTVMALETLFFAKNARTLAQVGHSRGVILLTAGQYNMDVCEYAPRQIKLALTGFGGADKHQIQLMIQRLLNLSSIPKPDDAADAVAVALCHMQYTNAFGRSALTV